MITNKLRIIFGLSIPLFIAHGIEEFVTGFQVADVLNQRMFGIFFGNLTSHDIMFITFQTMLWLLLVIAFLLLLGEKWQFRVLAIAGTVYVYELHHVIKAVQIWSYYPGLITALAFPLVAVIFWKEWLKVYNNIKKPW